MAIVLETPAQWIAYIALGGVMGVTGQFIRALGGAKKTSDQASAMNVGFQDVFSGTVFLTSLTIGFAAGVLASLGTKPTEISTSFLLGIVAAGYAGADFIEAFMKKSLPDTQQAAQNFEKKVDVNRQAAVGAPAAAAAPGMTMLVARSAVALSVSNEVRAVIARCKGHSITDATDEKKLSDLDYNAGDCLALEQAINRHFFNDLNLVFDRLLDGPEDIKPDLTVAQVIATVKSLHPHPRS